MSDIGMGYGEMQVTNLCKGYGIGPLHKEVIKDCSFTLEKSKLTVLIGPSGCGKSALINMLAGYETPDAGSILIDGEKVSGPGPDRLVVFQETALFPWMTVFENVSYGPRVRGELSGKDLENTTMKLLEMVGLEDFRSKYPSQLSGGMQRRAELVRAMINQPKVMMMDEPFRGLDAMTRALMQEYYVRLFEEHRGTNLFVTSELEEGIFLADRLVVLTNQPCQVKKDFMASSCSSSSTSRLMSTYSGMAIMSKVRGRGRLTSMTFLTWERSTRRIFSKPTPSSGRIRPSPAWKGTNNP